jgi:hypothetical protein
VLKAGLDEITGGGTVVVVVVVMGVVVSAGGGVGGGGDVSAIVTVTDCDGLLKVFLVLLFVKPIENEDAVVRVDVTATPFAMAELVALIVHIVGEVWVMAVIAEIPVRLKSTPAVIESVVQSIVPLPVTVKVIAAEVDVADGIPRIAANNVVS